jgi:hypothetical protein
LAAAIVRGPAAKQDGLVSDGPIHRFDGVARYAALDARPAELGLSWT